MISMAKWMYPNYQSSVESFNWNENEEALVVRFRNQMPFQQFEVEASAAKFTPVDKELYRKLKTEIQSQEKQLYESKWFFEDIRTPTDIRKRIKDKTSVADVDTTPGGTMTDGSRRNTRY